MTTYREGLPPLPVQMRGPVRRHPLYHLWKAMIRRCYRPTAISYHNYGGLGVSVCRRWRCNFWAFVDDMPPRPSPAHSIDRFPNKRGNYEPSNVRWATRSEQARNTRLNRLLTANGKTQTLEEWAIETGIPKSTLFNRLKRGWNDQACITCAVQGKMPDHSLFPPGGRGRCAQLGLNPYSVASRLRRGWLFEEALSIPMAPAKGGRGHAQA
jgi:hypothetical protein